MAATRRLRHQQSWFVATLAVIGAFSFSPASYAATSSISLQVTAVVQNTCSMAVTPSASATLAAPRNGVRVDCQYGQAYTVNVEPAAVDAGTAPGKSAGSIPGSTMVVTVTY